MQKEFTIKSDGNQYRVGKITPIEILAITSIYNTNGDLDNVMQIYTFALEHTEVKMGEKWFPVKSKGVQVYCPTGIEENPEALMEISFYILNEVVAKSFTKSNE